MALYSFEDCSIVLLLMDNNHIDYKTNEKP